MLSGCTVSGPIVEVQSFTNNTYHVKPRGVLHGETTGEEYDISYEFNGFPVYGDDFDNWVMPILLKHDGKLVAVLHVAWHVVYNGQGMEIIERSVIDVNCK